MKMTKKHDVSGHGCCRCTGTNCANINYCLHCYLSWSRWGWRVQILSLFPGPDGCQGGEVGFSLSHLSQLLHLHLDNTHTHTHPKLNQLYIECKCDGETYTIESSSPPTSFAFNFRRSCSGSSCRARDWKANMKNNNLSDVQDKCFIIQLNKLSQKKLLTSPQIIRICTQVMQNKGTW